MNPRPLSFASAALAGLLLAAGPALAVTPQERLKACSAEWTAAQAAKTVPAGQTRKDFLAACAARTADTPAAPATAASPASAPQAAGTQPAPPAAGAQPATPTPAPAAVASTPQSRMKQCSTEWQAAKAAGKVPTGQNWQKFYSECNLRLQGGAAAAQPAAATPAAKPVATPAAVPTSTPAKPAATAPAKPEDEDTGEGVKNPTQAQLAARARIKECGTEWRAQKAAGKTPANETWPHFWSTCNARLKAAGK